MNLIFELLLALLSDLILDRLTPGLAKLWKI